MFDVVVIARYLADIVRALVVRRQLADREGPAAVLDPRPMFAVDGIERAAPAAPGIGTAAEKAQLAEVQRIVRQADIAAAIERLVLPGKFQAAAFQQAHAATVADEFPRQADARGARTDHREIRLDDSAVLQLRRADEHL